MNFEEAAILSGVILFGAWAVWADIPMIPKLKFVERKKNKTTGLDSFYLSDKKGNQYVIAIESQGINSTCSSLIINKENMGSGAIGVALFSLPTLPLWLPFIVPTNLYFSAKEKVLGKSRHAAAILQKVKSSMPRKDYEDLKAAFEKDWVRHAS